MSTVEKEPNGSEGLQCQRCGRDRPDRRKRFRIVLEDHSPSSTAYETFLLCVECWEKAQQQLRRCLA